MISWRSLEKNVKKRLALTLALLVVLATGLNTVAQDSKNTETSVCSFEDGKEVSIRYNPAEYPKRYQIPNGKPWAPGDTAILLFTPTDLKAGNATVATGAYSMYILRNKTDWTLIVSRNTKESAPYDATQDVVRIPMGTGKTSAVRTAFSAHLGHIAPKVCSIQINFGDTGAFADFTQK